MTLVQVVRITQKDKWEQDSNVEQGLQTNSKKGSNHNKASNKPYSTNYKKKEEK